MPMSGRDVVVVSAAAALGGGLVAIAFTSGALWNQGRQPGFLPGFPQVQSSKRKLLHLTLQPWIKPLVRCLTLHSLHLADVDDGTKEERDHCVSLSTPSEPGWRQQVQIAAEENRIEGLCRNPEHDLSGELCLENGQCVCSTSPLCYRAGKLDPFNPSKRQGYLSWDDYFMSIAFLSARRSKDPNRQVGACIVSQDRVILGIGYNGFPRGCSDDELPWAKMSVNGDPLQTKYPYVCHAEVNAILNKNQASAAGQRLYVTLFPCNECAKVIIQAGIVEVVYFSDKGASVDNCSSQPDPVYTASRKLLSMAGVKVWQHQPATRTLVLELR